jgi:peptidoglycan/LPS O-acetylase OafA/YrhL
MGHLFARRIFRLQPSYLHFLACYAVFASKHAALSWWVLFLPLSNWLGGPYITWHIKTLHIEETYYIFIGICSGIFWRTLKSIMWTMLLLAPLGRVFIFVMVKLGGETARWLQDHFLPVEAFAVGGLLVLYLEKVQEFRFVKAIMHKPAICFGVAMLALLITAGLRPVKPFSYVLLFTWPMLFSMFSAVMILSGLQKERFFFSAEWLRKLGLVSYTVYLFQQFSLGPWQENYGAGFR